MNLNDQVNYVRQPDDQLTNDGSNQPWLPAMVTSHGYCANAPRNGSNYGNVPRSQVIHDYVTLKSDIIMKHTIRWLVDLHA